MKFHLLALTALLVIPLAGCADSALAPEPEAATATAEQAAAKAIAPPQIQGPDEIYSGCTHFFGVNNIRTQDGGTWEAYPEFTNSTVGISITSYSFRSSNAQVTGHLEAGEPDDEVIIRWRNSPTSSWVYKHVTLLRGDPLTGCQA